MFSSMTTSLLIFTMLFASARAPEASPRMISTTAKHVKPRFIREILFGPFFFRRHPIHRQRREYSINPVSLKIMTIAMMAAQYR